MKNDLKANATKWSLQAIKSYQDYPSDWHNKSLKPFYREKFNVFTGLRAFFQEK